MKSGSLALTVELTNESGEDDEDRTDCCPGSKKLRLVIMLSVISTLIEVVAAMLLHSNIIMANVIDGSYEAILLFINYRGMIYEENGHRKRAIRFANVTDTMLIIGCLGVLWGSIETWNTPQAVNGLGVAGISFVSVLFNLWALFICPRLGLNGRSAFIKVIGGNLLVMIGCLGGLAVWAGYQQFDSLAGGLVALIIGCYVAYNLKTRARTRSLLSSL